MFERAYSYLVRVASKKEPNVQEDRAVLVCFLMVVPFLILITASSVLIIKNFGLQYRPKISLYGWLVFLLLLCCFNFLLFLRKKRYIELARQAKTFDEKTLKKHDAIALFFLLGPIFISFLIFALP